MPRFPSAALVVVLSAFPLRASGDTPGEPPRSTLAVASAPAPALDLEAFVAGEVRRLGHPGVAVGVVEGGRVVYDEGFGVRDKYRGGKVTPQTVFRLASVTKVFAGVALLALRDEGKLSLDDPLTRWIPEANHLIYATSERVPITLRQLVTHTSGVPRDIPAGGTSEAQFLGKLGWVRLESTPGRHTSYSNFGAALVGPIVHRASAMAFRDFMSTRIFGPLGMSHTAWERADVDPLLLATGHKRDKDTDALEPERGEWRMGAAEAFGGAYSSVEDMERFLLFELSAWDGGPEAPDGHLPLPRSSLRESQTLAVTQVPAPPEPVRYGVAWLLEDDKDFGPRVLHSGATDEFSASIVMLPRRGIGAVVLSNAPYPADTEAVARRIARRLAEAAPKSVAETAQK
jgi:CubicO group peptidase (beta-lactamase class C family)